MKIILWLTLAFACVAFAHDNDWKPEAKTPEPATMLLTALGVGALVAGAWRKNRK